MWKTKGRKVTTFPYYEGGKEAWAGGGNYNKLIIYGLMHLLMGF